MAIRGANSVTLVTDVLREAPARLEWMTAEVVRIGDETPRVRSLWLRVPDWPRHLAGQHIDVRLTGEDGYSAQRSYSIASPPEEALIELTVQRLTSGEVSPYLTSDVQVGDKFQLRGPVGYHFVWKTELGGPLFLIGGGSGIVPLMAMLRHRRAMGSRVPAILIYSSRTEADIIYRAELDAMAAEGGLGLVHTLTDIVPADWRGERRRIDRKMIEAVGFAASDRPHIFICGPAGLVEAAARHLVELGHDAGMIKTERFGPTGV